MSYIRASVVAALTLTLGVIFAPTAGAVRPADSTPCAKRLISAHEGYTRHADGDTVESQKAAFRVGSNIADSDVWVTKDGYIVEIHDDDVSHSTDGHGLVTDLTLEQVEALRTWRFHEMVPQLSDSLALPEGQEAGRYFMFETKSSFAGKANLQKLADEISAAGMTDHVIIYTWYMHQAHTLKTIDPDLTVWYKAQGHVPTVDQVAGLNGVMIPAGLLTADVTNTFHAVGMTVIRERVATETPAAWQRFVDSGADGMMTARPKIAVAECRALP